MEGRAEPDQAINEPIVQRRKSEGRRARSELKVTSGLLTSAQPEQRGGCWGSQEVSGVREGRPGRAAALASLRLGQGTTLFQEPAGDSVWR